MDEIRVTGVELTYEWVAVWLSAAGVKVKCVLLNQKPTGGPNTDGDGDELAGRRAPVTLP